MNPARRRLLLLPAAALAATGAAAQPAPVAPPELAGELSGARLQGTARMTFLGLAIYEARLWTGAQAVGTEWAGVPFAMELVYARSLKGPLIAERSLKEMRRQAEIAEPEAERWLANMKLLFPDVNAGDRITGTNLPGVGARFHANGAFRGEPHEPEFARLFFGIWLSPRTSEPALREQLLGRAR